MKLHRFELLFFDDTVITRYILSWGSVKQPISIYLDLAVFQQTQIVVYVFTLWCVCYYFYLTYQHLHVHTNDLLSPDVTWTSGCTCRSTCLM